MPLPNSGPLRLSAIRSEFPGETIPRFSKYYRKGKRVADIPNNSKIPLDGRIRLSDFRDSRYFLPGFYELTITQQAQIDGSDYFHYGYFNGLSSPYHKVTHGNHQNASGITGSYILKKSDLTEYALDPLKSVSYGSLAVQSSGSFTTGYAVYALPFSVPALGYKAHTAPDPTNGYVMTSTEAMIQLTVNQGRYQTIISQTPSSSNGYTTVVLCNDDPPGSNSTYSFTLTYRWFVVAP